MNKVARILFVLLLLSATQICGCEHSLAKEQLKAHSPAEDTPSVLIGSSIPSGLEQVRIHKQLKQGDLILTSLPKKKEEALAVARYCKENKIYLFLSELISRGKYRTRISSEIDFDEVVDTAGEYYFGRFSTCELGGVLYWPKAYTINRRVDEYVNLTPCDTVDQAQKAYIDYARKWIEYDRKAIGKGPLINGGPSLACKYHAMADFDILCLEVLPADPHMMYSAMRGTARAFDKNWGAIIAMQAYGGMNFDELYQKRWRTVLFYSYIVGANFIYSESGHYTYSNKGRGQMYDFDSEETKRIRRVIREAWQFARIHKRPAGGPKTTLGIVHGNHDGTPGFWTRYVWGQFHDEKWLEGPPEYGWRFVDKFYRKEDWPKETVQGNEDFSGNPPYGQYDIVPIEAELNVLQQYKCLVFLGWNTMTTEIYEKLKKYVAAGGHLVMSLPHLSTSVDRTEDLKLLRDGDVSDLFGVKVKGKGQKDVRGIKCIADSSLKSYRFPLWRSRTDPRFIGNLTPARLEITTGRIISGWSDYYYVNSEEVAAEPMLIENSYGRGKTFLVTAWEYPGDDNLTKFTNDILRVVLQGEQGDIRLLSSDRIRYAVYEDKLPHSDKKYSVIYLLNTDPDSNSFAQLWINGRRTNEFIIPANDLRLAYLCGDIVLIPEDKCVDIKDWKISENGQVIELYNARRQTVEVHNVGQSRLTVSLNGVKSLCKVGEKKLLSLKKNIDPARKDFFASDFLDEPAVDYVHSHLPY